MYFSRISTIADSLEGVRMKIILWILKTSIALLLCSSRVLSQASDDLEAKYGKRLNAFEVRPGIMMRLQRGATGQGVEMRIEPFSGTDSSLYFHRTMEASLVKEVIDQLVPMSERGKPGSAFGLTVIYGSTWRASYDYDFVAITLTGSVSVDNPPWEPATKENPFHWAQVILIKWNDK